MPASNIAYPLSYGQHETVHSQVILPKVNLVQDMLKKVSYTVRAALGKKEMPSSFLTTKRRPFVRRLTDYLGGKGESLHAYLSLSDVQALRSTNAPLFDAAFMSLTDHAVQSVLNWHAQGQYPADVAAALQAHFKPVKNAYSLDFDLLHQAMEDALLSLLKAKGSAENVYKCLLTAFHHPLVSKASTAANGESAGPKATGVLVQS